MKYLITIPHEESPKLIEYICDFSEIKQNFSGLKALLSIKTKSDLLALRKYKKKFYNSPKSEVRQLLASIDINTLAD